MRTFLFLLILQLLHHASAEGERCGRPGRPVNGTVSTTGKFYYPGERVAYSCLEGFVLFGPDERTCRNNGTWSEDVPLCDFNLARGKRALQSENLWDYNPGLAVDGDADTCSFTPQRPDSRWWQVHLGHKFNVVSVSVTISPGSFQEFTIYVIDLLADSNALYKPCTTFKGVFKSAKKLFHCNDRLGHPGQFVYIRDDRKDEEYFGLCEVEVFAFRERIPCGDPEIPVGGKMERLGEERAQYSCTPGYTLEGDNTLTCNSRGKWQGQTPKCREIHCSPPPSINQGYVEVKNFRGVHVFGTEARYVCNSGHVMVGSSVISCDHTGKWSPEAPKCEAVSCGPPPQFQNTKVTLLSGSTHWNDIAVYTCFDGYSLHPDTDNPVSTCLNEGKWKEINITCVKHAFPVSTSAVRKDNGRSLNLEMLSLPEPPQNVNDVTVIVLAVVAGVLCLIVIIALVLLTRRRMLSGPGSLSPLVRSSDKMSDGSSSKHYPHISASMNDSRSNNYSEMGLCGPGALQDNLLATLQRQANYHSKNPNSDNNFHDLDFPGFCDHDPQYEKVRCRSEHSYETIRKKSLAPSVDFESGDEETTHDPGYETVQGEKISIGFEVAKNTKDPGYETVKSNHHDYETLKEKDPGYETVKDEGGYETVIEDNKKSTHGYETVKPKIKDNPNKIPIEDTDQVPDILQNIASNGGTPIGSLSDVPPEIQALYAKVDLSKKRRERQKMNDGVISSEDESNNPDNSKAPTKALIKKFNNLSHEESKKIETDSISSTGTLRPLPPLPNNS